MDLETKVRENLWTSQNVTFDSEKPKIPYEEEKGVITLPKIFPLKLEDPHRSELRYHQKVTNWLIENCLTRLYGEGIIGCGKTEAGEELAHLFPSVMKVHPEKVDGDVFLTFYMDMGLHGAALQPFLADERRRLNGSVGEFVDPSYKDRSPVADLIFAKLLGVNEEDSRLLDSMVAKNPYKPNMIYLFECSVDTAMGRVKNRAKKDEKRKFELEGQTGRMLSPEEIASVGRGVHKLIAASERHRSPEAHRKYLEEIYQKGLPVLYKPQGVTGGYLQALHGAYKDFGKLCQKFELNNVLAPIDVNNINVKDDRYHLALVFALKYGRCVDLIRKGFTIREDRQKGLFTVTDLSGKTKYFRPGE